MGLCPDPIGESLCSFSCLTLQEVQNFPNKSGFGGSDILGNYELGALRIGVCNTWLAGFLGPSFR